MDLIVVAFPLLRRLLHLDRVAEAERTQEQLLPLLKEGLEKEAFTNKQSFE